MARRCGGGGAQVPLFCTDLSSLPLAGASASRACNVKVRAGTRTPGTLRRGQAGAPQPGLLDTRVLGSPERRGGARGGGCGRAAACGGATAEVVLGAPPLAGSRWGQIFGESVAMGTGRLGRGGGLKMQSQSPTPPHPHPTPPQAAVTMTTSTGPRQGQAGWGQPWAGGGGRVGPAVIGGRRGGRVPQAPAARLGTE